MTFPMLMAKVATSAAGWSKLVLMLAIPATAIGVLRMIFVKEKYNVDATTTSGEKIKVKDIGAVLKTNKYILIIALMTFVFNFVCNMGVNVYYFTYVVGNVGLMGILAAAQVIALPMALAFPKLISKFSTINLIIVGFLVSAVGYLLNAIAGANVGILVVGAILTGAGTVPASMLIALVIIECADYNEWKGIPRMEGTMSSINGLAQKIGAAIGTGALGFLLSMVGYTGDAATISDGAVMMIRLLFGIVPMILYLLTALTLKGYKLNKMMPQIKAENEARRAEAANK